MLVVIQSYRYDISMLSLGTHFTILSVLHLTSPACSLREEEAEYDSRVGKHYRYKTQSEILVRAF